MDSKARPGMRVNPKSRPKKFGIAKLDILRVLLLLVMASLFRAMALLKAESSSSLLAIVESHRGFF